MPVWSPILKGDCDVIEIVQHRATKLVSSINELSYNNRLKALNLTTLVERRQRGDMIQLYKIIHGVDKLDRGNHFQIVYNTKLEVTALNTSAKNTGSSKEKTFSSIDQLNFGIRCQIN